ncbi:hypothetical protein HNR44_000840 [Geomicrobium halophilum]|uniref:Competence protein ComGG n=1 Tax=Geomicrobium halophilum TaxID=549000 RepID=A0A841PRI2_9BACL|nr:competence type IV pilus minor pilin ComGG [Geomicrobium halophilum]MBB6448891.1 hypothetical protein [Geomicrobium halophilum]
MDQKGAVMPFVLIICLILAGLVSHQASLLVAEREGLQAQQRFLIANVLLAKGEANWWEEYRRGRTSSHGSWKFKEGEVHYHTLPTSNGYKSVHLKAETEEGGTLQHYYYVRKAGVESRSVTAEDKDNEG